MVALSPGCVSWTSCCYLPACFGAFDALVFAGYVFIHCKRAMRFCQRPRGLLLTGAWFVRCCCRCPFSGLPISDRCAFVVVTVPLLLLCAWRPSAPAARCRSA